MKLLISLLLLMICIIVSPYKANAMWVALTDTELIQQSDIIVIGELIGQTQVMLMACQERLSLGVLQVKEVLKGDKAQTLLLLELPSPEVPRASTDISYKKGQKGLWFLRVRNPGEIGIYLADHPQRFLAIEQMADQIEVFQKKLKTEQ